MTRSRSLGRRPTDLRARERLRDAQTAEARAVTAVYAAEAGRDAAIERRDQAWAAAAALVDAAEDDLAVARAAVVTVSGLDRAAVLLGTAKADLRKATTMRAAAASADEDRS
jgi:hypothetical protein